MRSLFISLIICSSSFIASGADQATGTSSKGVTASKSRGVNDLVEAISALDRRSKMSSQICRALDKGGVLGRIYLSPMFPGRTTTFLHEAIRAGDEKVVQIILCRLEFEATDVINTPNSLGNTPLHEAVMVGSLAINRMLLASGADLTRTNGMGHTPLQNVAGGGNTKLAALLLEWGAQIDELGDCGKTPLEINLENLMYPVHHMAKFLLARGATVPGRLPEASQEPSSLFGIPKCQRSKVHEYILKTRGWSELHFAVDSRDLPRVKELLEEKPEDKDLKAGSHEMRMTPAQVAQSDSHLLACPINDAISAMVISQLIKFYSRS